MHTRRQFIAASAALASASASAAGAPVTTLFADRATTLADVKLEPNGELWVRPKDLPRINEFELKPQGACRADVCIPTPKSLTKNGWFHLTGFSRRIGQSYVADSNTYSFGEVPILRGGYLRARQAPDFAVPDRKGRPVHLSDFKGKKVLIVTWASW